MTGSTGDSAGGAISAESVRVSPGTGALVRRPRALLFVARTDASANVVITAFLGAPESDAIDAVTDAVTAARFDVPPFVVLAWADRLHLDRLDVVVFGPIEVVTDHASLPMLSGAGSGSWVERRLRLDVAAVRVEVASSTGAASDPVSDLQLGRVLADGFVATFHRADAPTAVPEPANAAVPERAVAPARAVVAPAVVDPTGPIGGDRLAALRAAMRAHDIEPAVAPVAVPIDSSPDTSSPAPMDDEITLAPEDPPPDTAPEAESDGGAADAAAPALHDGDESAPFVVAVRCGRGHVNATHVSVCRTCGDLLDANAPQETVRQPPLAVLELAGGESIPIDRPLVVGRRPDLETAQATNRALAVVVADDASVSRTHLRIDVEDWSLTVVDCGSRSGTAIVTRPGEEPRILEPWMAHELPIGARLFLGGPSSVVVRPTATGRRS